jgi:hypothetical protein
MMTVHNRKVTVDPDLLQTEEFDTLYTLDITKDKSDFNMYMLFIYYMYDRASLYFNILPSDRKKIVCIDVLKKDENYYSILESNPIFVSAINKYLLLVRTPAEKLLEGIKKKIDEYNDYWETTPINSKNRKEISESIYTGKDLLDLYKKLEKQVSEEKNIKSVGGSKPTLIEELNK